MNSPLSSKSELPAAAIGSSAFMDDAAVASKETDTATLSISVIVPVRNEESFIEEILRQLSDQDYPEGLVEILVIDGCSTDRTCEVVREFAKQHSSVRLLQNPHQISSAARNVGVRHSSGDVIVIIDGHCHIGHKRYFRELCDAFIKSEADCIGRPQPLDVPCATIVQRAIAAARNSKLGHHPDSFIYSSEERFVPALSVGVAYRRSVFEQIGLFDESFDACEDVEFNYRVDCSGMRCLLAPKVALHYHPRRTLIGLWEQLFRYGRGRVRLFRKHPSTLSLKTFAPAAFIVMVGLLAAAAPFVAPVGWVTLVVIASYLLVILAFSGLIAGRHRSAKLLVWLPLVFGTIHMGAGMGILAELVSARHS